MVRFDDTHDALYIRIDITFNVTPEQVASDRYNSLVLMRSI
jgi:hypothetical protein